MAMLDKLKMTDKTPRAAFSAPEAHLRRKFLKGLNIQITAAEAHSKGETFIRRGKRWVEPSTIDRLLTRSRLLGKESGNKDWLAKVDHRIFFPLLSTCRMNG